MAQSVEHIVHIDGVVGSSPTVTTTRKPLQIKDFHFFIPRHHCRGVHFFQGSPRRRERLVPPFRSHGRLAQLPENRGGFVGGIMKKGITEVALG